MTKRIRKPEGPKKGMLFARSVVLAGGGAVFLGSAVLRLLVTVMAKEETPSEADLEAALSFPAARRLSCCSFE